MDNYRVLFIKFSILTFPFRQIGLCPFWAHESIQILSIETEHTGHEIKIFSSSLFTESKLSDKLSSLEIVYLAAFSIGLNNW